MINNKKAITLMCRSLKENFVFLNYSKWAETVMSNHALPAREEMEMLTSDFIQLAENNGVELKFLKEMVSEGCN